MAKVSPSMASHSTAVVFFLLCFSTTRSYGYAETLEKNQFDLKEEKMTHFRLYWHDIYSGSNPTAMPVVMPKNSSSTLFGAISMIDDPLTEGPELSSKLVGRAQGLYASASQEESGLLMVMTFHFLEGKYNGSNISVLGRNKVFSPMREMPVIGGSGIFRFARGYVEARTHMFNTTTGDATVEYNVYVLH